MCFEVEMVFVYTTERRDYVYVGEFEGFKYVCLRLKHTCFCVMGFVCLEVEDVRTCVSVYVNRRWESDVYFFT